MVAVGQWVDSLSQVPKRRTAPKSESAKSHNHTFTLDYPLTSKQDYGIVCPPYKLRNDERFASCSAGSCSSSL